jgi:hypothetical protein
MTKNQPRPGVIEVYAIRLSRLYHLKQLCNDGHPVLTTEMHLIEMAKAKLQEYILIHFNDQKLRSELIFNIRNLIINKIRFHNGRIDALTLLFIDVHLNELSDPN